MTVLTPANAFPGMPFPQHKSGQTNTVQSYLYPGAVLPNPIPPPPSVLSYTNAFPNLAFPQHKASQSAVQTFLFPGAVQPIVNPSAFMIFSQQTITIPLLMTVPVSVTLHNP